MKKWQDNTENHSRKQQQSLGPRNHTQCQCPCIKFFDSLIQQATVVIIEHPRYSLTGKECGDH